MFSIQGLRHCRDEEVFAPQNITHRKTDQLKSMLKKRKQPKSAKVSNVESSNAPGQRVGTNATL